jgi:predicted nucleic acid-binding protein
VSYIAIDTDVASAAFRDRLPAPVKARLTNRTMCITFVTLGELTKWTVIRDWGPRKVTDLETWRQHHALVLPVNQKVAITWGLIEARAQKRGRPRPINDTWIAASCIALGVPLITFNLKDFEDFAEHEGLQLVDGGRPVRP